MTVVLLGLGLFALNGLIWLGVRNELRQQRAYLRALANIRRRR